MNDSHTLKYFNEDILQFKLCKNPVLISSELLNSNSMCLMRVCTNHTLPMMMVDQGSIHTIIMAYMGFFSFRSGTLLNELHAFQMHFNH